MRYQLPAVLFVLAATAASLAAQAHNGPASKEDIERCANWLKPLVPQNMRLDVGRFCAGLKQTDNPDLGGWYSARFCGATAKAAADGKEPYCASSGAITDDWTVAAGFRSEAGAGRDLMPAQNGDAGIPAILYTRTPTQIDVLRLPAGLYQITISHPADGWKMAVAAEAGKKIGTVSLEEDEHSISSDGGLAIAVQYSGFHCKDPVNVHELIFSYGGKDLYACFRPDRIAPSAEDAAMENNVGPRPVTGAR